MKMIVYDELCHSIHYLQGFVYVKGFDASFMFSRIILISVTMASRMMIHWVLTMRTIVINNDNFDDIFNVTVASHCTYE